MSTAIAIPNTLLDISPLEMALLEMYTQETWK